MRVGLLHFLRKNVFLVIPVFIAVGVLIEGAYRRSGDEGAPDVEAIPEVVGLPPVRYVDKSSWVYLSDYLSQLMRSAVPSLALVGR